MNGVNKVILVGTVGKDPEVRHLENGSVVANFSLATNESYKDKMGQKIENTEWHDLELWEGLAKVAEQYVKKGSTLYVEGKMKKDTWQNDQGGNRSRIKIRVQNMTMIGSAKPSDGQASQASTAGAPSNPTPSGPDIVQSDAPTDDLPF
jgi:single-strand DNA-binding protein